MSIRWVVTIVTADVLPQVNLSQALGSSPTKQCHRFFLGTFFESAPLFLHILCTFQVHVPKLCSTIFAHQNLQNLGWKIFAPPVLHPIKAVSANPHRDWRRMEKTDLQNLIDYHSSRILLLEIGGDSSVAKNFYKVSLDGQLVVNCIC